jgi:phosphate transport system permease protein
MTRHGPVTVAVWAVAVVAMALLVAVVGDVVVTGWPALSWGFVAGAPRTLAAGGGVGPLLFNTVYMVGLALVVSVPVGFLAAIYRTEYGGGGWVEQVATVLTSVPSVVVGLALFVLLVATAHWPFSRLTGSLALAALNLPWATAAGVPVLRQVPDSRREASLALGGSVWMTVWRVVVPEALPRLVSVLAVGAARLLGEAAALIYTAGVNAPSRFTWSPWAPGGTLAVHLWQVRTEGLMPDANQVAAATGVVLLGLMAGVLALGGGVAHWLGQRAGMRR